MNDKTVTVENALECILKSAQAMGREDIPILEASGRVLYKDIISKIDVPPHDNSAMDGYAVISKDTAGASRENPVKLKITGEIKAGDDAEGLNLAPGCAVRIMTGGPIPRGADSVIMVEDTSEEDETVNIFRELKYNENYRFAGEDLKSGSVVLRKGHRLKSPDIGLLASLNIDKIAVYKKPVVAIIATGNEIVDIGEEIKPGQIRNSNSYSLSSEVMKYNGEPVYIGIARDTIEETRVKIDEALKYDIVITTGGVSMGKYDFVNDVLKELEVDILFEWVKMKPGRPCIFGKKKNTLFFGLPGNPVSTMISFIQFVRPAILRTMGAGKIEKPVVKAILEEDIKKKPDRTNFIRGYFSVKNGDIFVNTTGPQGSGILKSMSIANCLIILPIGLERAKSGDIVHIQLINHEEI